MLQLLSLNKWFFIQVSIIHDNTSSQVLDKRRYGFGKWMNLSIIHDNICKLIHKKCHPKVTIVTLNIIFSVVHFVVQVASQLWIFILYKVHIKVGWNSANTNLLSLFINSQIFYTTIISHSNYFFFQSSINNHVQIHYKYIVFICEEFIWPSTSKCLYVIRWVIFEDTNHIYRYQQVCLPRLLLSIVANFKSIKITICVTMRKRLGPGGIQRQ